MVLVRVVVGVRVGVQVAVMVGVFDGVGVLVGVGVSVLVEMAVAVSVCVAVGVSVSVGNGSWSSTPCALADNNGGKMTRTINKLPSNINISVQNLMVRCVESVRRILSIQSLQGGIR